MNVSVEDVSKLLTGTVVSVCKQLLPHKQQLRLQGSIEISANSQALCTVNFNEHINLAKRHEGDKSPAHEENKHVKLRKKSKMDQGIDNFSECPSGSPVHSPITNLGGSPSSECRMNCLVCQALQGWLKDRADAQTKTASLESLGTNKSRQHHHPPKKCVDLSRAGVLQGGLYQGKSSDRKCYQKAAKDNNGAFKCSICGKCFTFSTNLTRHQRNVHGRDHARRTKDIIGEYQRLRALGFKGARALEESEERDDSSSASNDDETPFIESRFSTDDSDGGFDSDRDTDQVGNAASADEDDTVPPCLNSSNLLWNGQNEPSSPVGHAEPTENVLAEVPGTPTTVRQIHHDIHSPSANGAGAADAHPAISSRSNPDASKETEAVPRYTPMSEVPPASLSYPCQICGRRFEFYHNLGRHMKMAHRTSVIAVEMESGGRETTGSPQSDTDADAASKPSGHQCSVCGHTFSFRSNLCRHMKKVHTEKQAGNCSPRPNKANRTRPVKSSTTKIKGSRCVCSLCGTSFSFSNNLSRHMRQVHKMVRAATTQPDYDVGHTDH